MRSAKYFVILVWLIILISSISTDAELPPHVRIIKCPNDTLVGERGSFTFQINNQENSKLMIKNIDVALNGDFQENVTNSQIILEQIDVPLTIAPHDALTLDGKFRTEISGIHYIDLNLLYNFENNDFSLTKEICEVNVIPKESSFDALIVGIIIAGAAAGFAGLVTSLVKLFFVRKNFKFEQDILSEKRQHEQMVQHQHWLFQKMHSLAEKYYVPLAKFAWDAMQNISKSSASKNKQVIDIAYNDICLFLNKYTDFKRTVGANFLFKDREFEKSAIGKIQAILTGLPFDEIDIEKIVLNVANSEKKLEKNVLSGIPYKHFSQWIKSKHCKQSRTLVEKKLNEFQKILDEQGERISSPEYFDEEHKKKPEQDNVSDVKMWISHLSSKKSGPEEEIFVYGKGFDETGYNYQFYIGEKLVSSLQKINDEQVKVVTPADISKGTYDLYAKGTTQTGEEFETIGIVVHIE